MAGVDRESGHDRSATFVGYLALSILGSCGGALLAPDLLGCLRYTLGKCFLMGVVASLCGSWTACRRLSVVQLVREIIRADRSGNAGSLGPDAQAGCRWTVSLCPQYDDKRRFLFAVGSSVDLGIVGCRSLGFVILCGQSYVLCFIRRAWSGAALWRQLQDVQGQRAALDPAIKAMGRLMSLHMLCPLWAKSGITQLGQKVRPPHDGLRSGAFTQSRLAEIDQIGAAQRKSA